MDHHDLAWYDAMTGTVVSEVSLAFGVLVQGNDRTDIRDAIYRAVNNAKVKAAEVKASGD